MVQAAGRAHLLRLVATRRTRQDREVSRESLAALGELPVEAAPTTEASERAAEIIHTAMAALNPDERLVLTLLELEDHSVAETAGLTGWSEANVKVRAHRARAALKRVLFAQGKIMEDLPK